MKINQDKLIMLKVAFQNAHEVKVYGKFKNDPPFDVDVTLKKEALEFVAAAVTLAVENKLIPAPVIGD